MLVYFKLVLRACSRKCNGATSGHTFRWVAEFGVKPLHRNPAQVHVLIHSFLYKVLAVINFTHDAVNPWIENKIYFIFKLMKFHFGYRDITSHGR